MAVNLISRDSRIIRNTLLTMPTLVSGMTQLGIVKIFLEDAPDNIPLPYITICHNSGGESESRRFAITEALWKVTAHAATLSEAMQYGELVQGLNGMTPITGLGECAFDTFEQILPIIRRYVTQNNVLFEVGTLIRVPIQQEN